MFFFVFRGLAIFIVRSMAEGEGAHLAPPLWARADRNYGYGRPRHPGEMTAPARAASPRCSQRGQRGLDGWYIASYMILADRCLPKIVQWRGLRGLGRASKR